MQLCRFLLFCGLSRFGIKNREISDKVMIYGAPCICVCKFARFTVLSSTLLRTQPGEKRFDVENCELVFPLSRYTSLPLWESIGNAVSFLKLPAYCHAFVHRLHLSHFHQAAVNGKPQRNKFSIAVSTSLFHFVEIVESCLE